jgi:hypothetical protein
MRWTIDPAGIESERPGQMAGLHFLPPHPIALRTIAQWPPCRKGDEEISGVPRYFVEFTNGPHTLVDTLWHAHIVVSAIGAVALFWLGNTEKNYGPSLSTTVDELARKWPPVVTLPTH